MTGELAALSVAAASVGFFHTIFGPDHYLPFVMMSWARKWSSAKTAVITLLCGLGHIGSSVVLGFVGVSLGLALKKLELVESVRGNLAAWLFTAFGLVYFVWGLHRAYRKHPHRHAHAHSDVTPHTHTHNHFGYHTHVHDTEGAVSIAPWVLFAVFVFGPCETLIPFVMYPAARQGWFELVVVTSVFGIATIATMLAVVLLGRAGVNFLPLTKIQRFSHATAGAAILLCGLAIVLLGL